MERIIVKQQKKYDKQKTNLTNMESGMAKKHFKQEKINEKREK